MNYADPCFMWFMNKAWAYLVKKNFQWRRTPTNQKMPETDQEARPRFLLGIQIHSTLSYLQPRNKKYNQNLIIWEKFGTDSQRYFYYKK